MIELTNNNPFKSESSYIEFRRGWAEGTTDSEPTYAQLIEHINSIGMYCIEPSISFDDFQGIWRWHASVGKLERVNCMACEKEFMGAPPQRCCDGRECGCMGMPIYPIACSAECYNKIIKP